MVKFNISSYTTNTKKIQELANLITSPQVKNLVKRESNIFASNLKTKLPENLSRTKISRKKTLINSLQISEPKFTKAKLSGLDDVKKIGVSISLKPFQKYFAVVLSGNNTYSTSNGRIKKPIDYQNSLAIPFPFSNNKRHHDDISYNEFYQMVIKSLNGLNDE